jgi:hypothetical protein
VYRDVGLRPGVTGDAPAEIDALEPDYQRTIRTPRPQGPEAIFASLGIDVDDGSIGHRPDDRATHHLSLESPEYLVAAHDDAVDLDR